MSSRCVVQPLRCHVEPHVRLAWRRRDSNTRFGHDNKVNLFSPNVNDTIFWIAELSWVVINKKGDTRAYGKTNFRKMNPFNSTLKPTCWDRCLISLAKGKRIRPYSTTRPSPNDSKHIDKWFQSIVKPVEFYELHAEGNVRRYFYNIDLQGRLFLGTFMEWVLCLLFPAF